jgi:hypothetical protein
MPLVMWRVNRIWRRPEPATWPVPGRGPPPGLEPYEYSLFSQNGEDGILRHLFAEIGFRSRRSVEFGFSTNECNSLRLVLHERFSGLFLDGSDWQVDRCNRALARLGRADTRAVRVFLTRESRTSPAGRDHAISGGDDVPVMVQRANGRSLLAGILAALVSEARRASADSLASPRVVVQFQPCASRTAIMVSSMCSRSAGFRAWRWGTCSRPNRCARCRAGRRL